MAKNKISPASGLISANTFMSLAAVAVLIAGLIVSGLLNVVPARLTSKAAPADKILVCHVPPGRPQAAVVISISKNAWETGHDPHAAHSLDFAMEAGLTCPADSDEESSE